MLKLIIICMALVCMSFAQARGQDVDTRKLFTEEIQNDFDAFEDSLCFTNDSFSGHTGFNPYLMVLAKIADSKGACQGMMGVAAASKKHIVFRPNQKKMSTGKLRRQIHRAVRLHHNDCKGKVFIDGYKSLRNLCEDQADLLRQRSLTYNVTLAITEILPKGGTFFFPGPLSKPQKLYAHLLKELTSIYEDLRKGEYPLMLVHDHVTMVTGMKVERDRDGYVRSLTLSHYDPNYLMSSAQDLSERTYNFSPDGKEITGTLIWNITPRSPTHLACLFIPKN